MVQFRVLGYQVNKRICQVPGSPLRHALTWPNADSQRLRGSNPEPLAFRVLQSGPGCSSKGIRIRVILKPKQLAICLI